MDNKLHEVLQDCTVSTKLPNGKSARDSPTAGHASLARPL